MIEWHQYEVRADAPAAVKRLPKWSLRIAVSTTGTIYVPAVLGGSEMSVYLSAAYDGVPMIMDKKHAYCPADWMVREFPRCRPMIERIRQNMRL